MFYQTPANFRPEKWSGGATRQERQGRPGERGGRGEAGEKRMLIYTGTGRGYPLLVWLVATDISLPRLSNIKDL